MPGKLRNQFFVAFLILIILPTSILQIYQFLKIEWLMESSINELNANYLEGLARTAEDLKRNVLKSMLMLEKNKNISSMLREPERYDLVERKVEFDNRFETMRSFVASGSSYVYFMIADMHGNLYTSFSPGASVTYQNIVYSREFADLRNTENAYQWIVHENRLEGKSSNAFMLSLFSVAADDEGKPYGMVRISIDYQQWLTSSAKEYSSGQKFFIVDGADRVIASAGPGTNDIAPGIAKKLTLERTKGHMIDKKTASIYNVQYIADTDWFLISRFPLDMFFGDLEAIRKQVVTTSLIIAASFALVTFLISSSVTKPLRILEKKMTLMAKNNLKVKLPEDRHKGEILALNQSFNRMVGDMDKLIHQLKHEERQKEAIHFQMLLNQMNPHFLLNTLNTIKWIAVDQQSTQIYEISLSLGKLLEACLNSEVELVYLKDEIELVKAYVLIQKYRHSDLFDVKYDIDKGADYVLVPKLCLQPLVENAIQHGFSHMEHGGMIHIRISADGQTLNIEVEDNGIGAAVAETASNRKRKGIGIANIRTRLQLLFKQEARFEWSQSFNGTLVKMTFPMLVSVPYTEGGDSHVEAVDRGR